ncbi:Transposable element P transposase, partial [Camponotus floridanus]
ATHGLVFMLAGLASRWKQTVAYYFTGNKVNGAKLKPLIENIISKAEGIGLHVHNVTSDMGPCNQAMWKAFGVHVSQFEVNNNCTHPCDNNRLLFFYSDVPHALKNIKTGFVKNQTIIIPDNFVNKYALPTSIVHCSHLNDILAADEACDIKLAHKLRSEYLSKNNHFQKMRVNTAMRVLSKQVALSFHNLEKFNETVAFLHEVIELFAALKVGQAGHWKPFQTAIIMSTTTVIQLTSFLLNNRHYNFFLPSRLTQDCIENLFSLLRMKNVVLNALQFKNNLKLISISQYMKNISNSNYEYDDREFLSDFFNILMENRKPVRECEEQIEIPNVVIQKIVFSKIELNKIYYIAGYLIANINKRERICQTCISAAGSKNSNNNF